MKKIKSMVISVMTLLLIFNFTCCSFNIDMDSENDRQCIGREMLNEKKNELPTLVQSYFEEKYGEDIKTSITFQNVAGGTFLGSTPEDELYHHLIVNVINDDVISECAVNVHGRIIDEDLELYVKEESYYGQSISKKMIEWMDFYVKQSDLSDYIIEFTGSTQYFPAECPIDISADEIITLISGNDNISVSQSIYFILKISESEYNKNNDISNDFSNLQSYLKKIDGNITLMLNVYSDEDYKFVKEGVDSTFESVDKIEIIGNKI